jgi:hypothetical protein
MYISCFTSFEWSPTPVLFEISERWAPLLFFDRPMLMEKPDIIVATPTRALAHIKAGNLNLKQSLELLIIDEADLLFSFGYEDDVKGILR